MKEAIQKSILSGFIFSITIFMTMSTYALITNNWYNPSTLEATSGNTLNFSSWNKLLSNFTNLDSRLNAVYNTGTTNTKVSYTQCAVGNPQKTKVYNCNGSINRTIAANTDRVALQCPTGMKIISGGGRTTGSLRESRPDYSNGIEWMIAGNGTFGTINAVCMKIE